MPITPVQKVPTGIPGFDTMAHGGLPVGRTTIVAGSAGSAKTLFASQFLAGGILEHDETGVFVTFEETPVDLRRNLVSLGWDVQAWEEAGRWRFVDASPDPANDLALDGSWDFDALMIRIERAVEAVGAKRVVVDSLGAVFSEFSDSGRVRRELRRLARGLRELDVTAVMTVERTSEYGDISRWNVEEFVAEDVVILRNILEDEAARRTMQILKFRGTTHRKGEFPFAVINDRGIVALPLADAALTTLQSRSERIRSGNDELDRMCGGGPFRDSISLVSGATGTGKTLTVTEFLAGGARNQERCLLFAFEESRAQLVRNALGWGVDYEQMERDGLLRIVAAYPETASLEEHLVKVTDEVRTFAPRRFALDSLSALERASTLRGFRHFVIGITSMLKEQEVTGMYTATTPSLMGGESVTESHISTLTDAIVLLRYVEVQGEVKRAISVLKMRGSVHDRDIRQITIDGSGMRIGEPFRNISGVLSGAPRQLGPDEFETVGSGG
ncbi:circadian clock protein KaiC [Egicoccus halophilus]|uniref:non-specific serine/threonine protein kinase n=1 Tax=Egicoccus halophilus TaxID=1670830 RepID=A0A8J3EUN5_9ACTN|nr:circadian clock protein KaiC [Egicoccus halophilus]GGI08058.1 circadian clock protein KaiC [Egicoccus halophilus]